jgi:hypothetical protein
MVPDLAVGYTRYDIERDDYTTDDEHRNADVLPGRANPAGCAYTTVEDLWRFATALTSHQLLDAAHTALVTTGRGHVGWTARRFGYGFFEEHIGGIRVFGHDGAAPGMNCDFQIWSNTGHISSSTPGYPSYQTNIETLSMCANSPL